MLDVVCLCLYSLCVQCTLYRLLTLYDISCDGGHSHITRMQTQIISSLLYALIHLNLVNYFFKLPCDVILWLRLTLSLSAANWSRRYDLADLQLTCSLRNAPVELFFHISRSVEKEANRKTDSPFLEVTRAECSM